MTYIAIAPVDATKAKKRPIRALMEDMAIRAKKKKTALHSYMKPITIRIATGTTRRPIQTNTAISLRKDINLLFILLD